MLPTPCCYWPKKESPVNVILLVVITCIGKKLHAKISELCGLPGPYLTAMRTSSYLLSAMHELWYHVTEERPTSTREQAKMVGKYYWYNSQKLMKLGWQPVSSEAAMIRALSWLATSPHISPSIRATMHLMIRSMTTGIIKQYKNYQ